MSREEELIAQYRAEIEGWNWEWIMTTAKTNVEYDREAQDYLGRSYLGTIFGITPSGKM